MTKSIINTNNCGRHELSTEKSNVSVSSVGLFLLGFYHRRIFYYLSMMFLLLTRFKYTQSQHTKLILSIMALCCCCRRRRRWQRFSICFTIAISDHATSIQWYVNVWFYYKLIARSIIRHWWCLHEWMLSKRRRRRRRRLWNNADGTGSRLLNQSQNILLWLRCNKFFSVSL